MLCTQRPPAAAGLLAAQAAAGFSHARHAPFWAVRGRGHRTSAAPTKAHAAGLIPGLCTRGLASAYIACACARGVSCLRVASIAAEINPKPGPGWELPVAAQGAHPAIAGYPSALPRGYAAVRYWAALHVHPHAHADPDARPRASAKPLGPGALLLARRRCDGPARMQPGVLRKTQGWPRRRSCGCSGALRATASPKQTDHPFKHDCTVLASIYSCYYECIHVSYPPHHN